MKGSVEKRGENSYRLIVSGGFDSQGKRIIHRKTVQVEGKTDRSKKKNAENELAKFLAEIERGEFYDVKNIKLKDFADMWLTKYGKHNLAKRTYIRYEELINNRIIPDLGHKKLTEIRPHQLIKFYDSLQEEGARKDGKKGGLSPTTIIQIHRILSSMYNTAVRWEMAHSNPVERVKPPKKKRVEVDYYDEAQTEKLVKALREEPLKYQVFITLALVTGARRGELAALEWTDIDFEGSIININKSAHYIEGEGMSLSETKNTHSDRKVSVPDFAIDLLKEYRKQWLEIKLKIGDKWQEKDDLSQDYLETWEGKELLFTTWNGWPVHINSLSKWFRKFLERHDLPRIKLHALRHTAATLFIAWGIPTRTVSQILGHARTSTTQDIYAKSLETVEQVASRRMHEAFGKSENQ